MAGEKKDDLSLEAKVDQLVSYHAPRDIQVENITNVRNAAKGFILAIVRNCPAGPDRTAAIRKARESMMTANAAIVVPQLQI